MTGGHRRFHLWMWMVIAPLALLAVVLAVLLRPAEPVQEGVAPGSMFHDSPPAVREGEAPR